MYATCHTLLILLNFFTSITFGEEYKLKILKSIDNFRLNVNFFRLFFSQLPVLRAMENPDDYDIDTNLGTSIDDGDKTGM
jgi:hypothetical protein